MGKFIPAGLGWWQDLPDFRDFGPQLPAVRQRLDRLEPAGADGALPVAIDLREYFPEVHDQLHLNASTACACCALWQYFELCCQGKAIDPSPLFLYKTARSLLGLSGDTGSDLRSALKALVRFGAPPERHWPFRADRFDDELSPFLFGYSDRCRRVHYIRLDGRNVEGRETLERVKLFLAAGFPVVFGFPVPTSLTDEGDVPWRPTYDSLYGGQAVVAVGYDDNRIRATRGALLVRSSWGRQWGEDGYGWLPYPYVAEQLAVSFWTLLAPQWLQSGELKRPHPSAETTQQTLV